MMGSISLGMAKPLAVSQLVSAVGSVEASCTVSYGPTTCWEMTLTPPPPPLLLPDPPAPALTGAAVSPQVQEAQGGRFGAWMVVCVAESRAAKTMSELRPTCTCP